MKRNWYLWCDLFLFVLGCCWMIVAVIFLVTYLPPFFSMLTSFGLYLFFRGIAMLAYREVEKFPAGARSTRMFGDAVFSLYVSAIIFLLGAAASFFRLALERSDFGVWEVVGIYLCGGLIALLLELRRRRNNKKEEE